MSSQNQDPSLIVLNASAGSGKTYALVQQYLLFLLHADHYSDYFTKILAMTFTNKAAFEMKERVLKKLEELSFPDETNRATMEYFEEISRLSGLNKETIHQKCKLAFSHILHQYEDFHIQTIDKFTLKIIRSFAKELNLNNDFQVIVKDEEFFEKAVDLFIAKIGVKGNEVLTETVMKYYQFADEDEIKLQFKENLLEYCKLLSDENKTQLMESIFQSNLEQADLKNARDEKQEITNQFKQLRSSLLKRWESIGDISKLIKGKTPTYKAIQKILQNEDSIFKIVWSKTLEQSIENDDVYPADFKSDFYRLREISVQFNNQILIIDAYVQSFYFFKILKHLNQFFDELKNQENIIRLNEFKWMISKLVSTESSPFIYEKLGTRIQHYLLDEFQDTSMMQWYNLYPLLHDAMGHKNTNLIVGDAKQSIYRFRNGLAEMFVTLPKIYNPKQDPQVELTSQYFYQNGVKKQLENNFRSAKNIVQFNNAIFSYLTEKFPLLQSDFYENHSQQAKSSKQGYVEIYSYFTGKSKNQIQEEEKEQEEQLKNELILKWIRQAKADGYHGSDICILASKNKELNLISHYLIENGEKIESKETLIITNQERVKLSLLYLKKRISPKDTNLSKQFIEMYFRVQGSSTKSNLEDYLINPENSKKTLVLEDQFIADHYQNSLVFYKKYSSVYSLIQDFYFINHWDETKDAYIHSFADLIYNKELELGPNLKRIIEDIEKKNAYLFTSEKTENIKLMTVHKSKGLEFPVVIYYNKFKADEFKNMSEIFVLQQYPVKINLVKKYADIPEVNAFIEKEKRNIAIDHLNKDYVALTRPKDRLYMYASGHEIWHNATKHFSGCEEGEVHQYQVGNLEQVNKSIESKAIYEIHNIADHLYFPDISIQKNSFEDEKISFQEEKQYGIQFHQLMSSISNQNTISGLVDELIIEGKIDQKYRLEFIQKANNILENPQIESLYKNALHQMEEQDFIVGESISIRPDKIFFLDGETIILDYKTGLPRKKDVSQVKEYIQYLKEAEYPSIKGYLYYIATNELVEV